MKLYVVTHKEINEIPQGRTLIGVGPNKALKGIDVYDNTGENISAKNSNYCELTALYWIWKNETDNIIGLEHYQRFFCETIKNKFKQVTPLSVEEIDEILKSNDAILPEKVKTHRNVYNYYKKAKVYYSFENAHCIEDLDICIDIINSHFPEYRQSCERVMRSHKICMCNMFIMHKELLDEYCNWLFEILFLAEKKVDIKDKTDYQKRVFGFLSERLFNIWLDYKNLKIRYMPIYNIHDKPFYKNLRGQGLIRRLKRLFKSPKS